MHYHLWIMDSHILQDSQTHFWSWGWDQWILEKATFLPEIGKYLPFKLFDYFPRKNITGISCSYLKWNTSISSNPTIYLNEHLSHLTYRRAPTKKSNSKAAYLYLTIVSFCYLTGSYLYIKCVHYTRYWFTIRLHFIFSQCFYDQRRCFVFHT